MTAARSQSRSLGKDELSSLVLRNHSRRVARFVARVGVAVGTALACALLLAMPASADPTETTHFSGTDAATGMIAGRPAVDEATGDVYVLDANSGVVDRFSPSGAYIGQLTGVGTPALSLGLSGFDDDVAVDNSGGPTQGYVYVVGEQSAIGPGLFTAFDASGRLRWQRTGDYPSQNNLCGVTVDSAGNPWTTDSNSGVQERSASDGSLIPGTDVNDTFGPCHIAVDSTGVFYVNRFQNKVKKYAPNLLADTPVTLDSGPSFDVATDSVTGDVYTDHGSSIFGFDNTGVALSGTPFSPTTGSLTLNGVTVDGKHGTIFVTDSNNEVEIWSRGSGSPYPYVRGLAPSGVSGTGATLNGNVNPAGSNVTDCHFEYVSDTQFQIDGYASATSVPCASLPGNGTSDVAVSAAITGLTSHATYHYRVVATNGTGTVNGDDGTFQAIPTHTVTVVSGAGTVDADSGAISGCTSSGGTCAGAYSEGSTVQLTATPDAHMQVASMTVSSGNAAPTTCTSPSVTNPCSVTVNEDLTVTVTFAHIHHTVTVNKNGTGSGTVTVAGTLDGAASSIVCGATCSGPFDEGSSVRASASAAAGSTFAGWTVNGCSGLGDCSANVNTNTTITATFSQNPPDVTTGSASGISQTGATVGGTVNPNGSSVTDCHFDYGTSTSYGSTAACASGPGGGTAPVGVSASLSGLAAGTTYHYRVVAANAGGSTTGNDATFTTNALPRTCETDPTLCLQTPPPSCTTDHSLCAAKLAISGSHSATIRGTTAAVKVACTGDQGGTCAGTLKFTATIRVKIRKGRKTVVKKKTITVGTATYDFTVGGSGPLKIALTSAARNALKASGITAAARGLDGSITLPKAKGRKKRHA